MAGAQGELWVYNTATREFAGHFKQGSYDDTKTLAWSKANLLEPGDSQAIHVFAAPSGTLKLEICPLGKNRSLQYQNDHYAQSIMSPHGTLAAFGQVHGAISVWDALTGQRCFFLKAPQRQTCGIAFSGDDKTLAVASLLFKNQPSIDYPSGTEIALRDAHTGKLLRTWHWDDAQVWGPISYSGSLGYMGMAFSLDGATLACAATTGVTLWDASNGQLIRHLASNGNSGWLGRKWIAFSPSGASIAALGYGESIYVWSAKTGELLQVFHGSDFNEAIAFSPDGKLLATGGQDKKGNGVVKLWDVENLN